MYNLSTKAHEGPSSQRRPTQAHEEGKRPICMFFLIMYFFKNLQLIHDSLRRPTATNNNRYVFFYNVLFFKFTTYSRRPTKTERKPTRAHSSQRRPTQAHKEGQTAQM